MAPATMHILNATGPIHSTGAGITAVDQLTTHSEARCVSCPRATDTV